MQEFKFQSCFCSFNGNMIQNRVLGDKKKKLLTCPDMSREQQKVPKKAFYTSMFVSKEVVKLFELQQRQGDTSDPDQRILSESALSNSISLWWWRRRVKPFENKFVTGELFLSLWWPCSKRNKQQNNILAKVSTPFLGLCFCLEEDDIF